MSWSLRQVRISALHTFQLRVDGSIFDLLLLDSAMLLPSLAIVLRYKAITLAVLQLR
jgi:hypothetical protein